MRTLELRLETVEHFHGGKPNFTDYASADRGRIVAALEFFDRALVSALSGTAGTALDNIRGISPAHDAFNEAAALTLLRFGVRIVGLEEEKS